MNLSLLHKVYTPNANPIDTLPFPIHTRPSATLFILNQASGSKNGCGALERSTWTAIGLLV